MVLNYDSIIEINLSKVKVTLMVRCEYTTRIDLHKMLHIECSIYDKVRGTVIAEDGLTTTIQPHDWLARIQ